MLHKLKIIQMEILSQFEGMMLIGSFFLAMVAIIFMLRKRKQTKEEFLVANRCAPWLLAAFSMAATWVWAPSMFTAAEKAYTQGFAGVFWFVVPNVLTLILFAFFANKMRKFNRARGTHLLEPMENIVKKLLDEGLSVDEISKKIGMSREEIFRLSKIDRETFLKLVTSRGSQSFSKAQVVRQG